MVTVEDIFGYILIAGGLIQALIVIFHVEWYFKIWRVQKFMDFAGEKIGKIIYLVFCILCIGYGILMIIKSG